MSTGNAHTGWKCPDCGRCYAPAVLECSTCNSHAALPQPSLPFPTWPNIVGPFVPTAPTIIVGETSVGAMNDYVDSLFTSAIVAADNLAGTQVTLGRIDDELRQ